jgi:hypothetical protein
VIRLIGDDRPEVREVPWWESAPEIASEAITSRAFVTYHARDDNGVSEVAIVSWWYKSPSLVALFRGAELVGGELREEQMPRRREDYAEALRLWRTNALDLEHKPKAAAFGLTEAEAEEIEGAAK